MSNCRVGEMNRRKCAKARMAIMHRLLRPSAAISLILPKVKSLTEMAVFLFKHFELKTIEHVYACNH